MIKYLYLLFFIVGALSGCKTGKKNLDVESGTLTVAKTPVTIAYPTDTIRETENIVLSAVASYLLKSDVKANTTGYITQMNIKLMSNVRRGQLLFALQTKEARALGNTINQLDPSFRFNGGTSVVSPSTGYVAMLNHQIGDYVQDGEILATITDESSFGFVLNVPYEYNQLIKNNNRLIVHLPDGRNLNGYVARVMPVLDSVSQTQKVLIKVTDKGQVPENLIANIQLTRQIATGISVPKASVLTDETQSSFWVMKLLNDTIAIKVDIQKGVETDKWVQIKSANLSKTDRVVTSGNYGLSDTAFVTIEK